MSFWNRFAYFGRWLYTDRVHSVTRSTTFMQCLRTRPRLLFVRPTLSPFRTLRFRKMTKAVSFRQTFQDTPVNVPSELSVNLTPVEDRLCTLLDECKRDLESKGEDIVCRIAGGWVRDKVRPIRLSWSKPSNTTGASSS